MSICTSAGGRGSDQLPVVSCVNRQPTASNPSASVNSGEKNDAMLDRSEVALCQVSPAASGCLVGKAHLPIPVWKTGAPNRSATRASTSSAPAETTPPPARISGRFHSASSFARDSTACGEGLFGGGGCGSVGSEP